MGEDLFSGPRSRTILDRVSRPCSEQAVLERLNISDTRVDGVAADTV